jgi:hypothetical protein
MQSAIPMKVFFLHFFNKQKGNTTIACVVATKQH